jgi:hypothetical protein
MHVEQSRFDLTQATDRKVATFKDVFWRNTELCSNCFQRIRHVGDEVVRHTDIHRHVTNAYYERSEHSDAEWSAWDAPTDRYGTTYCEDCGGASGHRWQSTRSLAELKPVARNILDYTLRETAYDLDGAALGAALRDLKTGPDARDRQGRDVECLAVAWARTAEPETPR